MNNIIFHIGLHKTGTTFLQREYFPKLPVTYTRGAQPFYKVMETTGTNTRPVLISEENLSGQLFSGNKQQQFVNTLTAIKNAFPNAKIIIGFRNHLDFIVSSYKQMLHEGGTMDFNTFYNLENTGVLKHEDLGFREMTAFLYANFNDVLVYTIDDLKDMSSFNLKISQFIGIKPINIEVKQKSVNKSVRSSVQVNSLLKLNRFDAGFKKNIGFKLLYSKAFKFLKITPRNICQHYLPEKGKVFAIDKDIQEKVQSKFKDDWNYILNQSIH